MPSAHYHLAQINVARALGPLDSPVMAGFMAQLDAMNALADESPGFIWRLTDATDVQAFADPRVLINMSVWESVDALRDYAHRSGHREPLRDRAQWFEKPAQAHLAFWWIPAGHVPTVAEACDRLEFRRTHGDSPVAFSFGRAFPQPEEPAAEAVAPAWDFDHRVFLTAANTPNGNCTSDTRFRYRQNGGRIWATYDGGTVRFGSIVAVGDSRGRLDMRYQHVDVANQLRTGKCTASPEVLPDGRIRLLEEWQWTNGDFSEGRSVVEEIAR